MDTCLDRLEWTQTEFHEAFDDWMEDVEDKVQSLKREMEHSERTIGSIKGDIQNVELLVANAHHQLERVEDYVDGFLKSLRTNAVISLTQAHGAPIEAQRVEEELNPKIKGWFGSWSSVTPSSIRSLFFWRSWTR
jgi:hypothetical protein